MRLSITGSREARSLVESGFDIGWVLVLTLLLLSLFSLFDSICWNGVETVEEAVVETDEAEVANS